MLALISVQHFKGVEPFHDFISLVLLINHNVGRLVRVLFSIYGEED